jgi:hypothetical protein
MQRRFRLSLRSLPVVVLVAVPFLVPVASNREREAVQLVTRLGGGIGYNLPPPYPWQRLLGREYFASVNMVCLDGTAVRDSDLRVVGSLHDLEELTLTRTEITDSGLENLRSLRRLKRLWLTQSGVTDDGVNRLREALPHCQIIK